MVSLLEKLIEVPLVDYLDLVCFLVDGIGLFIVHINFFYLFLKEEFRTFFIQFPVDAFDNLIDFVLVLDL